MGDNALNAKNAKALLFVNTGDDALDVKSADALLFVNMAGTQSLLCIYYYVSYDAIILFHRMTE